MVFNIYSNTVYALNRKLVFHIEVTKLRNIIRSLAKRWFYGVSVGDIIIHLAFPCNMRAKNDFTIERLGHLSKVK